METYTIDHESYGMRTTFASLAEAQETIRACGPDFKATTLSVSGSQILDENGTAVGSESNTTTRTRRAIYAAIAQFSNRE